MAQILVVEDYRDNRQVVELILRDADHTVLSARDGASGIDLAARARPDLILMDLALPEIDGWEATRRIKADPVTKHIPVIAFTAYISQEAIDRAMKAGCSAVIVKPFEIGALLKQIDCLLVQERAKSA